MEGESAGVATGRVPETEPPWIYVLVRPIPSDPNQSWFVQPYPLIEAGGNWEATIFVGIESDPEGLPFDICAIVTNDLFAPADRLDQLPRALSRDCIFVTR